MFPYVPGGLDDFVDLVVPNYNAAVFSGANTQAERCARIRPAATREPLLSILSITRFPQGASIPALAQLFLAERFRSSGLWLTAWKSILRRPTFAFASRGGREAHEEHVALVPASRERNSDQVETNGRLQIGVPAPTAS